MITQTKVSSDNSPAFVHQTQREMVLISNNTFFSSPQSDDAAEDEILDPSSEETGLIWVKAPPTLLF